MPAEDLPESKRIFVIGGSRGIGRAIAIALAEDGYDVTITSREPEREARQVVEEMRLSKPDRAFGVEWLDVSDRGAVDHFASQIEADEGLYGLVYNAGQSYDQLAAAVDIERAVELMQVNFFGFMRLAGAALRPLVRAKTGRLVSIGSVTSLYGTSGNSTYAATKGAMLGYVRSLAVEVARKGVTVNYIAPGFVNTKLLEPYQAYMDILESQIPSGRIAEPEEVANLVRFVVSPGSRYMTGSILTVDGGLSANLISRRR